MKVYQIGENVIDGCNGICTVKDIMTLDFTDDKERRYYLMVPVKEADSKVYIPIETAENRFRKILSKKEIETLLNHINDIEAIWVDNDRQRERIYKEAVRSCDPKRLFGIIKTLYLRREKRNGEGKKGTVVDERYFKQAKDNLYSEIGFVLKLDNNEVKSLIKEKAKRMETKE